MSIVFGHFVEGKTVDAKDDAYKAEVSASKGETPHALTFAEFDEIVIKIPHDIGDGAIMNQRIIPEKYKGSLIELRPGAWTQEEIDAIMAGNITKLQTDDSNAYGKKWRMWVDGWPTEEQKQATPWETSI